MEDVPGGKNRDNDPLSIASILTIPDQQVSASKLMPNSTNIFSEIMSDMTAQSAEKHNKK